MSNEGYNPFPGIVHALTTCELQSLNTDGLEEGCLAKVATGKDNAACAYFRLSFANPPAAVTGVNVLATYNSGLPLTSGGLPCPTPFPNPPPDAHTTGGAARWIRTSIIDAAGI